MNFKFTKTLEMFRGINQSLAHLQSTQLHDHGTDKLVELLSTILTDLRVEELRRDKTLHRHVIRMLNWTTAVKASSAPKSQFDLGPAVCSQIGAFQSSNSTDSTDNWSINPIKPLECMFGRLPMNLDFEDRRLLYYCK